jgi:hypothetical protein
MTHEESEIVEALGWSADADDANAYVVLRLARELADLRRRCAAYVGTLGEIAVSDPDEARPCVSWARNVLAEFEQ